MLLTILSLNEKKTRLQHIMTCRCAFRPWCLHLCAAPSPLRSCSRIKCLDSDTKCSDWVSSYYCRLPWTSWRLDGNIEGVKLRNRVKNLDTKLQNVLSPSTWRLLNVLQQTNLLFVPHYNCIQAANHRPTDNQLRIIRHILIAISIVIVK